MRPDVVALAALLLVGVAAASAAGPVRSLAQAVAPSIVDGKNSTRVGWYVSLGNLKEGKWVSFCGGMLITQTTVLTAGHCMFNPQGVLDPPETVAIGIWNPATDKPDVDYDLATVINAVVHPRFLSPYFRLGYDIALLQLDPETVSGKNELVALPTYVPKPRNPVPGYTRLQAIGLGDVVGNLTRPVVLQRTELVLEPLETCDEAWPTSPVRPSFFKSTNICAGGPPDNRFTDTCAGDSGGPLFAPRTAGRPYDTAIGLVSYGINCKLLYDRLVFGKPGVYTNIAQLRKWIDGNLECLARGEPCPWGGTCFDNPANGCTACEPGLPPPGQRRATSPWKCATCTVPGYVVDPEVGQCRPKDCRDVIEDCIACERRRTLTCAACNPPTKLAGGKCMLRTCLDYDRGCQQCDPASPLSCAACKRGHALDPTTGKCVRVHQVRP